MVVYKETKQLCETKAYFNSIMRFLRVIHTLDAQEKLRAGSKELMAQKALPLLLDLKSSLGVEGEESKEC